MDLTETKLYGINEEEDYRCSFCVSENSDILDERDGFFKDSKGSRIDIYIKECVGNEPHIHLRDQHGNICRVKLRTNEYQRDSYEKNKKSRHSLDNNEILSFNKYMHSIVPGTENMTIWKFLASGWNILWSGNNPGKSGGLVDINKDCPDYSVINEPK